MEVRDENTGVIASLKVWWKKYPLFVVIGGIIALIVVAKIADVVFPPSPAQIQAQIQKQREADKAIEAERQTRQLERQEQKYYCKLRRVCARFARARQECAVAGDFDNCITVKLGDDDSDLTGYCSNDGEIIYANDAPPAVDCLLPQNW